jgi:hypothetical protein
VNEQVRAGVLTETDAKSHPWRHVVTRALSGAEDPQVDITEFDLQRGDRLLICSDGLSGVVPVDKIPRSSAAARRSTPPAASWWKPPTRRAARTTSPRPCCRLTSPEGYAA